MAVNRPIFVVGPHRSGTTLVYEKLAKHPDVGYLNRANRRLPAHPLVAHLLTRLGLAMRDKPMEAQSVWDRFRSRDDDVMGAEDATPAVSAWYRRLASRVLAARGASRFLAKYPRLSVRLAWLDAIVPDAVFLHVTRDWRAVVSSTVARKRKRDAREGGWFGVRIPGWTDLTGLPHEVVSARVYRHVTRVLERDGPTYGDRYVRVGYERLCRAPLEVFREVAESFDLGWSPRFEESLPTSLRSANFKWRQELDPAVVERIRVEDPEFYGAHEAPGPR